MLCRGQPPPANPNAQPAKDGIVSAISNRMTVNIDVIVITVNYGSNAK